MTNRDEILAVNESFYRGFNTQNLDLMKKVWSDSDEVVCIHPGWEAVKGFYSIIRSWEGIFGNSEGLEIKISHVEVEVSESLAWISCLENLFTMSMDGVQVSKVHATNLFRREEGQWRMVLHHASSIPSRSRGGNTPLN